MKRIFTLAILLIAFISGKAQNIEQVNYRGAFAPAPTAMWTEGWVNWDPQNTAYPAPTVTVSGNIITNTTWTRNNTYQLSGIVYVDTLVTLTIEPGTVIRGGATSSNSSLLIRRGGKLIAEGTPCSPIVFTSGFAAGNRSRGDWGGVIVLGRAVNNLTGGVGFIEGLTQGVQTAHGGTDNADNSGIIKYVRIEFGGFNFANNNEINGLTMGSVGSGTKVDYVQTSFIQDDAFEWFGGSVNASHLVSYQNLDDDFDTDNGFSGKIQFGLAVRDPNTADNPAISTSEGFESDNDATGSVNAPQTSAVFSNMTIIGPYRGNSAASVNTGFRRGARIRRNSAIKIFNSIFMDFASGILIESSGSIAGARFKNNIVALAAPQTAAAPFGGQQRTSDDPNTRTIFNANSNDSLGTTVGILITPYNFTAPDYRPAAGSPALSNFNFSDADLGTVVTPGAITAVPYRGAFAPAPTAMWTEGWVNWDPQNTAYPAPTVTVSGNITTNTTWTRNNTYQLSGIVYVDTLVTLTIEPGTVIRGGATSSNSSLLIRRGGKLIAEGTPCSPIVFTSGFAAGNRSRGDWGGVIVLGRAVNNLTGGVGFIEGLTQGVQTAHGGTDNADNSGIIKYVRIEFGGFNFANNNEINGLTMGSVGSGTKVDYVQTSFIQDDAFEWFGGSVNASHLVSYQNLDDDFDTDNGFSGKIQFGLAVRDPNTADNPAISTSEGFESDNDATGSVNAPQTSAVFSNMTIIGPYRGNSAASVNTGFRRGARIRRNSAIKIFNSIFMDFASGILIESSGSIAGARFKNNIVALAAPQTAAAPFGGQQRTSDDPNTRTIFNANSNDSLGTTVGILITPYNFTAPDYRPAAGSPALSNFDFSDAVLPVTLLKFKGETVKGEHLLYWETATEVNNTGFEVQRSTDGVSFSAIGFVASSALNGNSSQNLKYSFIDRNAREGLSYYRLKQVDKDGRSALSSVVVLEKSTSNSLRVKSIYPNPVNDQLNVSIVSPSKQVVTLRVNDVYGRIVTQKVFNLSEGGNNYQLNVKSLSKGNYFVNIITADANQIQTVQKFIKQ